MCETGDTFLGLDIKGFIRLYVNFMTLELNCLNQNIRSQNYFENQQQYWLYYIAHDWFVFLQMGTYKSISFILI